MAPGTQRRALARFCDLVLMKCQVEGQQSLEICVRTSYENAYIIPQDPDRFQKEKKKASFGAIEDFRDEETDSFRSVESLPLSPIMATGFLKKLLVFGVLVVVIFGRYYDLEELERQQDEYEEEMARHREEMARNGSNLMERGHYEL
jgi:hypothetical protein